MDEKLAIILLTTLMPAGAVAYILRTNGKTLNFAIIGGTVIYVASVVMIFGLIVGARWFNMDAGDLILLLPFGVAVLFYWLFKGSKLGDEK